MTGLQKYLLVSGLFIIAVGLFYGTPRTFIEASFGIALDDNALHIFRAIMGLYCGVGFIVLLGVRYPAYTRFSLLIETMFFGGIGFGRLISILVDGTINQVAVTATAFELLLFAICVVVLKISQKSTATGQDQHSP